MIAKFDKKTQNKQVKIKFMITSIKEILLGFNPHSNKLWWMWFVSPWNGDVFLINLKIKTLNVSNNGIINIDIESKGPLFLKSNNIFLL